VEDGLQDKMGVEGLIFGTPASETVDNGTCPSEFLDLALDLFFDIRASCYVQGPLV
jgi:hypothetical protein